MANKLKSYGDLFKTVKEETGSFIELGDLQKDIDNGLQIPEKDDNRAGRITECQYKNEHAEAVIKYLQCIQARIIAVQCCHDQ